MTNRKHLAVLLAGFSVCTAYAGSMGDIAPADKTLYLAGYANYNMFHAANATTQSTITGVSSPALASHISDQWGYGGGIGFVASKELRFDFIVQARPNIGYSVTDDLPETAQGTVDITSYMFNAYYTVSPLTTWDLSPYVTAGIGPSMANTSQIFWPGAAVNQLEGGHRVINFAWQVGAGISYAVTRSLDIDFNYEFVGLNQFSNSGVFTQLAPVGSSAAGVAPATGFKSLYDNQLQIGARYKFSV
ncbi:MAG: hypothetical protein CK424_08370 [Legionella sp.]|nr:MAG: hypothetical protein CK424_08370 [Legionella sp.]